MVTLDTKNKNILQVKRMDSISTNDLRNGNKVEIDNEPYTVVACEFIKPGKGQAFNRFKLKHLVSSRTVERTFKSGEKVAIADVEEYTMRLLYTDSDGPTFMDDTSFEQLSVAYSVLGDNRKWLIDEELYALTLYKGEIVSVTPPTFLDLVVKETAPGVRGDTASGRVLKPATLSTGAEISVPIFIEQDERVKVDTRTCEYVSRSSDK